MEIKASNEDEKVCAWCGKPGGRKRIDPYREELSGERKIVRLHDDCYSELAAEI